MPTRDAFDEHGFHVIPGAIPPALADAVRAALAGGASSGQHVGLRRRQPVLATPDCLQDPTFRYKDFHINNAACRAAIFAPPILAALTALLDGPVLAFQNLAFLHGSGLRIHRDSNYVAVDAPRPRVVACWIALEDVTPEAGPLRYYPGSHRLPRYRFADGHEHWVKGLHGIGANEDCHRWNAAQMAEAGLAPATFLARRGDCLLWDFDLVHEGLPPAPGATRSSLVTHFCPLAQQPAYLARNPDARCIRYSAAASFSSNHYYLRDIPSVEALDRAPAPPRVA